ncbi:MAG: AmmeMemoRadiSam system protein B [Candidatus Omnitrophota bacterium]|nr:AmmeMemoRadiSam system protein B [Candidatus Omnitrophota bacterium]
MPVRTPYVAGTFYPADPEELREYCRSQLATPRGPLIPKALIVPHAGYVYSGKTACRVFDSVRIPNRILLIGPNHSGVGTKFSVMSSGQWGSPLGNVPIDEEFAHTLLAASDDLSADESAHHLEHCLEVEVPFLQTKNPNIKIVPLVVGTLDLLSARAVALACGECLSKESEDPLLVVISSDMNHYEDDQTTRKKDAYAIDAILNLDEGALAKAVKEHRITMCGFVPVYMLLAMKKILGIHKATLIDYSTSADASGDKSRVVGYAGFIFE